MIRRQWKPFLEAIEEAGLKLESVDPTRRHVCATVSLGDESRKLFFPQSASDHRAALNFRSDVRRVLRELNGEKR